MAAEISWLIVEIMPHRTKTAVRRKSAYMKKAFGFVLAAALLQLFPPCAFADGVMWSVSAPRELKARKLSRPGWSGPPGANT